MLPIISMNSHEQLATSSQVDQSKDTFQKKSHFIFCPSHRSSPAGHGWFWFTSGMIAMAAVSIWGFVEAWRLPDQIDKVTHFQECDRRERAWGSRDRHMCKNLYSSL